MRQENFEEIRGATLHGMMQWSVICVARVGMVWIDVSEAKECGNRKYMTMAGGIPQRKLGVLDGLKNQSAFIIILGTQLACLRATFSSINFAQVMSCLKLVQMFTIIVMFFLFCVIFVFCVITTRIAENTIEDV